MSARFLLTVDVEAPEGWDISLIDGKHFVLNPIPSKAALYAAAEDLLALAQKCASECSNCEGTGVVNVRFGGDGYGGRCAAAADAEGPCPDCADVREIIRKAGGVA